MIYNHNRKLTDQVVSYRVCQLFNELSNIIFSLTTKTAFASGFCGLLKNCFYA